MTMTTTTERNPLAGLAADLAKRLPGFSFSEAEPEGYYREVHLVAASDGLHVQVHYLPGSNGKRISVSAWHPVCRELERGYSVGWMDAATYAVDRDLAAVARDIVRRVIEPGRVTLEVALQNKAKQDADRAALEQIVADFDAMKLPGLEAKMNDLHDVAVRYYAPARNEGGSDYSRYASIQARVAQAGYVNIDRCSIPLASFTALLALLGALPRDAA
jgi:hypothetical protein